jgi:hypothetical protein
MASQVAAVAYPAGSDQRQLAMNSLHDRHKDSIRFQEVGRSADVGALQPAYAAQPISHRAIGGNAVWNREGQDDFRQVDMARAEQRVP